MNNISRIITNLHHLPNAWRIGTGCTALVINCTKFYMQKTPAVG